MGGDMSVVIPCTYNNMDACIVLLPFENSVYVIHNFLTEIKIITDL